MTARRRAATYQGMNEHDVEEAWRRFQLHPVLGPAARTMANLVEWTNANSDGWPYWRKPSDAAAGLQNILMNALRMRGGDHPAVTADDYKLALRPLKSFRTRQLRERQAKGDGRFIAMFDIVEPLEPGMTGELWVAKLALADATRMHEEAARRERAAMELRRRAGFAVREAQQRIDGGRLADQVDALREHDADPDLARLALLARPGARVVLLPEFDPDGPGFRGLYQMGTSRGLTAMPDRSRDWGWALVIIRPDDVVLDHGDKRLYAHVVHTVADYAERWWITDADGENMLSGGHRDEQKMLDLRDREFPGGLVLQGRAFLPVEELARLEAGAEHEPENTVS